ncbi:MAG TPA: universal stress protein [Thermoleophilaceae bacterium]|nr:universal stress protein [Thermoleophilaceae bacterium]
MASAPTPAHARSDVPPPFGRIVCGVDGSPSGRHAIEQAIALCGPGTALVFVCVRSGTGVGPTQQATTTTERAGEALEAAVNGAAEAGIEAASEVLAGADPSPTLIEEASRSDLLVVGSHGGSRAGGIALGSTASAAVHRASVPVLVARRPPENVPFAQRLLVGSDGSAGAARAVELAARIGRSHRSRVYFLSVEPESHGDPTQIAVHQVHLAAKLSVEPIVVRESGHAEERIVALAEDQSVSLIAVGSRGLTGVRALGSVSERVAHRARCSVLVARPA